MRQRTSRFQKEFTKQYVSHILKSQCVIFNAPKYCHQDLEEFYHQTVRRVKDVVIEVLTSPLTGSEADKERKLRESSQNSMFPSF